MATSNKKIEANRRNATHSTGPRTPEGKKRSSRNSLIHGLLADEAVTAGVDRLEDLLSFENLNASLFAFYQPESPVEVLLVEKIIMCWWRLKKAGRYEAACSLRNYLDQVNDDYSPKLDAKDPDIYNDMARIRRHRVRESGFDTPMLPDERRLNLVIRYEAASNRDLERAERMLDRARRERRAERIEWETPDPTEMIEAMAERGKRKLDPAKWQVATMALMKAAKARREEAERALNEASSPAGETENCGTKPNAEYPAPILDDCDGFLGAEQLQAIADAFRKPSDDDPPPDSDA